MTIRDLTPQEQSGLTDRTFSLQPFWPVLATLTFQVTEDGTAWITDDGRVGLPAWFYDPKYNLPTGALTKPAPKGPFLLREESSSVLRPLLEIFMGAEPTYPEPVEHFPAVNYTDPPAGLGPTGLTEAGKVRALAGLHQSLQAETKERRAHGQTVWYMLAAEGQPGLRVSLPEPSGIEPLFALPDRPALAAVARDDFPRLVAAVIEPTPHLEEGAAFFHEDALGYPNFTILYASWMKNQINSSTTREEAGERRERLRALLSVAPKVLIP